MRVRLSDISEDSGLHIVTTRKPEWLVNIPELASEESDIHLASDISFDLYFTKILREINVRGRVDFLLEAPCARCLRIVDLALSSEVRLFLSPEHRGPEPRKEDIDYETYSGDEFNLGDYLREMIAVALPVKVLCREECRGLCSYCGADLNVHACSCTSGWIDPRFEILKNLKT